MADGEAGGMNAGEDVASLPVRIIAMPGPMADAGLAWVCQVLEHAGQAPQVVPLAEAAPGWRLGFGPVAPEAPFAGRTIVFLDTPSAMLLRLLAGRHDVLEVVREATAILAPLGPVLRAPGTLVIRRAPDMEKPAVRQAIARHLLPALPPPDVAMPCEADFDPTAPDPAFHGQAQALLRQVLEPMLAVANGAPEPIVWPLCAFYSGDRAGELAAPIVETAGPARILYYGPYFHAPAGDWRVDVQLFFSNDVPDSMLSAEIFTSELLAQVGMHPEHAGLFEAGMKVTLPDAGERVEFRLWTRFGAFSGHMGLRQVTLTPLARD